jgi:radical SAM superfamily enzyme YgiQ (UPF0313 family)
MAVASSNHSEDNEKCLKIPRRLSQVYVFSIATPLPGTRLYEMIGEEIRPQDYSSLNWNGSLLTEKLNKSTIINIVKERKHLKSKYFFKSISKAILSGKVISIFFLKKHRMKRIRASAGFILRTILGL